MRPWISVDGLVEEHRGGERLLGASGGSGLLAGDGAGLRVRPGELRPVPRRPRHRSCRCGADRHLRLDRLAGGAPTGPGQGGGDHRRARLGSGVGEPPSRRGPGVLRTPGAGRGEAGQSGPLAPTGSGPATQGAGRARSSRPRAATPRGSPRSPRAATARVLGARGRVGVPGRSGHSSRPGDRAADGVRRPASRRGPITAARRCRPGSPPGASGRKGGRERTVPVDRTFFTELAAYLRVERPPGLQTRECFVVLHGPTSGQALTEAGMRSVFRYHRTTSGATRVRPHRLRHTYGSELAAAGIDLLVLRDLMGHASPETTAGYVHLSNEHVAAEYAAARAVMGR